MSATATQSPPTPRCPQCGARMASEQDWCLECGNAVSTRVAPPPGWGIPIAVALATLGLLAAIVLLAANVLSDDADEAASGGPQRAATPTRTAPARRPARTAPATPPPTRTQTVPGAEEARGGGPVPVWPSSRQAYTLVALTTGDRAGAEARARQLISAGLDAGVLRTNGYDFFSDGYWVTWVGRYADRPAADRAVARVRARAPSAYVTLIRKRQG
ncbi:MAG TPA: SPOR domain-containing protein [Solirubrobacteraceae bacterium]|nr:SPOR domain-containing protein [Solirubrobacteraceae bacterium]